MTQVGAGVEKGRRNELELCKFAFYTDHLQGELLAHAA